MTPTGLKRSKSISGIASDLCSWYYASPEKKAQLDLIIDRSDRNIDLCEMKYSDHEYELKKEYVEYLKERRELFRKVTKTGKTLRLTIIAAGGIKRGIHTSSIQGMLSADDLFTCPPCLPHLLADHHIPRPEYDNHLVAG